MLTFEEALIKVTLLDNETRTLPDSQHPQTAFKSDIESSEFAEKVVRGTVFMLVDMLPSDHVDPVFAAAYIYQGYMNGLMMGVAVGVQMEKGEPAI